MDAGKCTAHTMLQPVTSRPCFPSRKKEPSQHTRQYVDTTSERLDHRSTIENESVLVPQGKVKFMTLCLFIQIFGNFRLPFHRWMNHDDGISGRVSSNFVARKRLVI